MPDIKTLAVPVGALLRQRAETVAVGESSAGGLISAALLAVPGASSYYKGGGVVYTAASKTSVLGVSDAAMKEAPTATETHALHLARATRTRFGSDWAVGETGAAGPTGNRNGAPPGHTCIAVVGEGVEDVVTVETRVTDRYDNMVSFAAAGVELLRSCIERAGSKEKS